jgi:hypothetical protein
MEKYDFPKLAKKLSDVLNKTIIEKESLEEENKSLREDLNIHTERIKVLENKILFLEQENKNFKSSLLEYNDSPQTSQFIANNTHPTSSQYNTTVPCTAMTSPNTMTRPNTSQSYELAGPRMDFKSSVSEMYRPKTTLPHTLQYSERPNPLVQLTTTVPYTAMTSPNTMTRPNTSQSYELAGPRMNFKSSVSEMYEPKTTLPHRLQYSERPNPLVQLTTTYEPTEIDKMFQEMTNKLQAINDKYI